MADFQQQSLELGLPEPLSVIRLTAVIAEESLPM